MVDTIAYGPVPSRRLGRSLGINNIPMKVCSYSCVYCQLGNTARMEVEPRPYYKAAKIVDNTIAKYCQVREKGEPVDFLAFVPDGEPTLDINLGGEITALNHIKVKVAVITNGSLLWRGDVRQALLKANWASLKVDAASDNVWHRINRPHGSLNLEAIRKGMIKFARAFKGELATETMLVRGLNDSAAEIEQIADFIKALKPSISYISVPTRPPAENVAPPVKKIINTAYEIFKKRLDNVECLINYEGNAFTFTNDLMKDLLGITAVHPMREEAMAALLNKAGIDLKTVQALVDQGKLKNLQYQGKKFYLQRLPDSKNLR